VPAVGERRYIGGVVKRDFLSFPAMVKDDMGNALGIAQFGERRRPPSLGRVLVSGVLEIR